jgi:hypothetical protein
MKMMKQLSTALKSEKVRTALAAAAFFLLVCVAALVSSSGSSSFLGQTLGAAFVPGEAEETEAVEEQLSAEDRAARAGASLEGMEALSASEVNSETLWLARCIYSETKRADEQELVAWVIRNRVETGYRGNDSYREAVLDPYQFSAFNPGSRKRASYASLDVSSQDNGWQRALLIANQVIEAPAAQRPFSEGTRHFFSERSMPGGRHPNWAARGEQVTPERHDIEEDRFRFYQKVR